MTRMVNFFEFAILKTRIRSAMGPQARASKDIAPMTPVLPDFSFEFEQTAPFSGDRFRFVLEGQDYCGQLIPGRQPCPVTEEVEGQLSAQEILSFLNGLDQAGIWTLQPDSAPPQVFVWSYRIIIRKNGLERQLVFRGEAGNTRLTSFLWNSLPGQLKRRMIALRPKSPFVD